MPATTVSPPVPTRITLLGRIAISRKPVTNVAAMPAERADAGQPADHGAGLRQAAQLQFHHHRRHRREQRRRDDDGDGGEQEHSPGVGTGEQRPGEAHQRQDRHDERAAGDHERGQQAPRIGAVGGRAAGPGADGDGGQREADDRGAGLQRDADVRGDQPQPDDLEHEHRAGAEEGDRRGDPAGQRLTGRRPLAGPLGGGGHGQKRAGWSAGSADRLRAGHELRARCSPRC